MLISKFGVLGFYNDSIKHENFKIYIEDIVILI